MRTEEIKTKNCLAYIHVFAFGTVILRLLFMLGDQEKKSSPLGVYKLSKFLKKKLFK